MTLIDCDDIDIEKKAVLKTYSKEQFMQLREDDHVSEDQLILSIDPENNR